ncbi:hypothetical protein GCM10023238_25620 [Streptomyces heliomycini]
MANGVRRTTGGEGQVRDRRGDHQRGARAEQHRAQVLLERGRRDGTPGGVRGGQRVGEGEGGQAGQVVRYVRGAVPGGDEGAAALLELRAEVARGQQVQPAGLS